jgi:hypothetical protein
LWLSRRIARVSAKLSEVSSEIARQQADTAKNKLRLDLFDRRWAVFEAAMQLAGMAVQSADITEQERRKFAVASRGAEFLFNKELQSYCDELVREAIKLRVTKQAMDAAAHADNQYEQRVDAWVEKTAWFSKQVDEIPERFAPFLQIQG